MEKLTAKEEEILGYFWEKGPMFVKDIVEMCDEPKPHFNTISTIVRALEEKGYVGHTQHGKSYQYHAIVAEEDMGKKRCHQLSGATSRTHICGLCRRLSRMAISL